MKNLIFAFVLLSSAAGAQVRVDTAGASLKVTSPTKEIGLPRYTDSNYTEFKIPFDSNYLSWRDFGLFEVRGDTVLISAKTGARVIKFVDGVVLMDDPNKVCNYLPNVNAGKDTTILGTTAILKVTVIDQDQPNGPFQYLWTKVSGQDYGQYLTSPTTATTNVNQIVGKGVFVFRVKVTDPLGGIRYDDVTVTKN